MSDPTKLVNLRVPDNLSYTNFSNVCHMNRVFGTAQCGNAAIDWDVLEKQAMMLRSEVDELDEAIANRDFKQVMDANGDIAVFNYGFGYICNFDFDKLMDNIYTSNLSKVHLTLEDAEKTVQSYHRESIATYVDQVEVDDQIFYVVKSATKQFRKRGERPVEPKNWFQALWQRLTGNVKTEVYGETIPADKTLKNIKWHEPNLDVEYPESSIIALDVSEALDV